MARLVPLMVLASTLAAQAARAAPSVSRAPAQMWLFLAPEEHVCAAPTSTWHDPSDALFFATGPTARHDAHELWAGGLARSSAPATRTACSGCWCSAPPKRGSSSTVRGCPL